MAIPNRGGWPALILVAATLGACEHTPGTSSGAHPTSPTPTPTPPAGPVVAAYHIGGVVTNDAGQPVANAQVIMNTCDKLNGAKCVYPIKVTYATTDAEGRYAMDVLAARDVEYKPAWLSNVIGLAYLPAVGDEFADDLQFVTTQTSIAVRNLRLTRDINLEAGGTATATFAADAPVCGDFLNVQCRYVRIKVPADGTVTVSAVPLNGVTAAAWLYLEDDPYGYGMATFTFSAKAGLHRVWVSLVPGFSGAPAYSISTTFQAKSQ